MTAFLANITRDIWIGLVVVALLLALPYSGVPLFYVQQAFIIFFFAALTQSWNILGGYGGYLSLGHAAFVGMGGYVVGILYLRFGLSPFLTLPFAALAAAALALLIGAICFRIRGSYFLIATMLVLFILQSLALNLKGLTNGANGIDLPLFTMDFRVEAHIWYYVGLACVVGATIVAILIERSRFGLSLMAIREDEDVARTMGVRTVQVKAAAFAISAAMAGILGAIYTYRAHVIEPFSAFSVQMSAAPILMAILGGSRTWAGPLLGAAIFQSLSIALTVLLGNEFSHIIFAVFLIVVVLLLPNGLIGLIKRRRSAPRVSASTAEEPVKA